MIIRQESTIDSILVLGNQVYLKKNNQRRHKNKSRLSLSNPYCGIKKGTLKSSHKALIILIIIIKYNVHMGVIRGAKLSNSKYLEPRQSQRGKLM